MTRSFLIVTELSYHNTRTTGMDTARISSIVEFSDDVITNEKWKETIKDIEAINTTDIVKCNVVNVVPLPA